MMLSGIDKYDQDIAVTEGIANEAELFHVLHSILRSLLSMLADGEGGPVSRPTMKISERRLIVLWFHFRHMYERKVSCHFFGA